MFILWRLVYAPMRWRLVIATAARALKWAELIGGTRLRDLLIGWFDIRVVRSGWPGHPPGWINLHASECLSSVRRVLAGPTITRHPFPARPWIGPVRIGLYGRFSGHLGLPRQLFAACPSDIELVAFDRRFNGRLADFLSPLCQTYVPIESDRFNREAFIDRVSRAVNAADLDIFLNFNDGRDEASAIIDRLDVPCVVNYCNGSDLLHNPRIDIQMFGQPEADYFRAQGVMFCGTTRAPFSTQPVMPIADYFDRRSLDIMAPRRAWVDREPLIVYHGSLYKMACPEYLDCVFDVMDADRAVRFVFMGKDRQGALASILEHARRRGVLDRVHYGGEFSAMRDAEGAVDNDGWQRLIGWLARARLAPDPWPIGGASARFEGYMMGVPSVHMAVRLDPKSWGRPQPSAVDVPCLQVDAGTVTSIADYRELCLRCLDDGAFADRLQAEQRAIARAASDEAAWWRQLRANYASWIHRVRV